MTPWTSHTGRAVPLHRANVDTDQIIPAEYCTRVTRDGLARGLFARWRAEPGFALNDPRYAAATVLLAEPDFGTGSSREHAVWALQDHGFAVVISARFGDIFARNALRNGLLPVVLPDEVVSLLMTRSAGDPDSLVHVDLVSRTVRACGGHWDFPVDERARRLLIEGRDAVDVTLSGVRRIGLYEESRPAWMPNTGASR